MVVGSFGATRRSIRGRDAAVCRGSATGRAVVGRRPRIVARRGRGAQSIVAFLDGILT